MEEKISDKICKDVFKEYYKRKDYKKSISTGKKTYRLLMKNDIKDTKDNYYSWMILMIIIKSYCNINLIEKSLKYMLISLRESNVEYRRIEAYYYLIQYYIKINNNTKRDYYFRKCAESCCKIGEYQMLMKIVKII